MRFTLLDQDFKPINVKDSYLIVMLFFRDENRSRNLYYEI